MGGAGQRGARCGRTYHTPLPTTTSWCAEEHRYATCTTFTTSVFIHQLISVVPGTPHIRPPDLAPQVQLPHQLYVRWTYAMDRMQRCASVENLAPNSHQWRYLTCSRYHRAPQLTETECASNHGNAVPPASVTVEACTWTQPPIPVTKRQRFLMSVRIKTCAPAPWAPSPPPSSALVCLASVLETIGDVFPAWPALPERSHCAVADVVRRPRYGAC